MEDRDLHRHWRELALQLSGVGSWLWLAKDDRIRWSPELLRLTGYPRELAPPSFDRYFDIVHPDDRALFRDHIRQGAEDGHYEAEYRIFRYDDRDLRHVRVRGVIAKDDVGRAISHIGIMQDVTDLKRVEADVRVAERRFRAFMEHAPSGVFIKDRELVHLFANKQAARLAGISLDEFIGVSAHELFPQEVAENLASVDRHVLETGETVVRETNIGTPERQIWVKDTKFRIPGSTPESHLVGAFAEDITEERTVEKQRRQLLAAIEQSGEMILITDERARILYGNPALARILEFDLEDLVGRVPDFMVDVDAETQTLKEVIRTVGAGRTWAGRLSILSSAGRRIPCRVTVSPVREEGSVTNYVAIVRDESREAERERRVAESQKIESIGRLAGGVAHDFNNMLQVILTNAHVALEDLDEISPADLRPMLDEIRSVGERAAGMTRQLLGFARQQPVRPEVINLADHVQRSLAMLARLIGEHIEVSLEAAIDAHAVCIDPSQLDQILSNLVLNARDAIRDSGEIRISIETARPDRRMIEAWNAPPSTDYVVLQIRDDGCGMSEETARMAFEPFYSTKDSSEGTGLGLATVYGIVKQNEGFIDFETEQGRGTTFSAYLPCVSSEVAGIEVEPARAVTRVPCSGRVLVVEDEKLLESLVSRVLMRAGFDVLSAHSPAMALELLADQGEV
ncbi:MAG: PAS domain S-box protein, partial [Pseudomonadota bacterium]